MASDLFSSKSSLWLAYVRRNPRTLLTLASSSSLLFQNLINQAGFNPNVLPLGSSPCVDPTAPCHVFWGGGNKTKGYASVILIANGLTFLVQALVFVGVGSLADFGNWNPWVVRGFSVLCWIFEFGFLGVKTAAKWRVSMALYILSSRFPPNYAIVFNDKSLTNYRCYILGVLRFLQCYFPQASP